MTPQHDNPDTQIPTPGLVVSHGIDTVDVARMANLLQTHGQHFLDRCFNPDEAAYAKDSKRYPEHLAARFAAKEAVLKALGTGLTQGITWTDIHIVRLPNGQPTITLTHSAAEVARARNITHWSLSMTHTDTLASASAIALTAVS